MNDTKPLDTRIKILGNSVLVELRPSLELEDPELQKALSKSNIVLQTDASMPNRTKYGAEKDADFNNGIILALGDAEKGIGQGKMNPNLKVGQRIFVGMHHGWVMVVGRKKYNLISCDNIFAIVDV